MSILALSPVKTCLCCKQDKPIEKYYSTLDTCYDCISYEDQQSISRMLEERKTKAKILEEYEKYQ